MNPIKIIKKILHLGHDIEAGKKWQASHHIDGKETAKRPEVTRFTCGLENGDVWFRYEFKENGSDTDLRGTISFKDKDEEIKYGGNDVESDDVVVSHRIAGVRLRAVVEFHFKLEGIEHRYRFDATVASIG